MPGIDKNSSTSIEAPGALQCGWSFSSSASSLLDSAWRMEYPATLLALGELRVRRERLDGADAPPVGRRREHEARADQDIVKEDRARAALALLARVLAAGEAETLAQRGQQRLVRRNRGLLGDSVDHKTERAHAIAATRVSARAPITASAWRR